MELEEILRKAVNPEGVVDLISDIGAEKTIVNTESKETAQYSQFRVQKIDHFYMNDSKGEKQFLECGKKYILCPVPYLFNEEKGIETGFAVDVDQDYFVVYTYMHNFKKNKSIMLAKLPHCKHNAITLDGSDYSKIGDEIKEVANEKSAVYFINTLLADLSTGIDSPIEIFDNKLYQQLINRLVSVKDPEWVNAKAVHLRFEEILKMYNDAVNSKDDMAENNIRKASVMLTNFLFGCEDLPVWNGGFICYVDINRIEPEYIERVYLDALRSGDVIIASKAEGLGSIRFNINRRKVLDAIQEGYKRVISNAELENMQAIERITQVTLDLETEGMKEAVQKGYEEALNRILDRAITTTDELVLFNKFTGINLDITREGIVDLLQDIYKKNLSYDSINIVYPLHRFTGVEIDTKREGMISAIQDSFIGCIGNYNIKGAKFIQLLSGVSPNLKLAGMLDAIEKAYLKFVEGGNIYAAEALQDWISVPLDVEDKNNFNIIQESYKTLARNNKLILCQALEEWTQVRPIINLLEYKKNMPAIEVEKENPEVPEWDPW